MSIRAFEPHRSLQHHDEVLIHDESRLAADPLTEHLAPPFKAASERLGIVERNQRLCQYAVVRSNALVAHWNDQTNATNEAIARELLHIAQGNRESARFTRYYKHNAPHEISKMGLANKLEATKLWPEMLADEPESTLSPLSARYATCLSSGLAALEARSRAERARDDHRNRDILTLIADLNTLREKTFAELIKLFDKTTAKKFLL